MLVIKAVSMRQKAVKNEGIACFRRNSSEVVAVFAMTAKVCGFDNRIEALRMIIQLLTDTCAQGLARCTRTIIDIEKDANFST